MYAGRVEAEPGDDYLFVLDGEHVLPDPYSRWQPHGLRGPSRVVDGTCLRNGGLRPRLRVDELVLYELHVGAFSESGTFDGVIERLAELRELGVTAIEVMPIGTFPGERNWGYDGVYMFAPHRVYGGPEGFARLVEAAHREGLGVVLDVVYNHIGPGSEAISAFGPYFTDRHQTPWGDALDYRERGVREWAIQNAEHWVRDYGVDGLRLDATHAVFDDSTRHVLAELADRVHALDPDALVIAEMETGDLRPIEEWGHDAQWADEFHHLLHVLLTGECDGYYGGYRPSATELARQYARAPAKRLVFCSQNHDQVGNRAFGDRPRRDELELRAAALLLAPQIPLLFMGEEYGERRPFQFFTDHTDPEIARATREGRAREFADFAAFARREIPDPQSPSTFERSKLDPAVGDEELRELYRTLLAVRRRGGDLTVVSSDGDGTLTLTRDGVEQRLDFGSRAVFRRWSGPSP
jgi:maltooligosyltrehalose trehalohydrolase